MTLDMHAFAGDWQLDPARSAYPFGLLSRGGRYLVRVDAGGGIEILSNWVTATGRPKELRFSGRADGMRTHTSTLVDSIECGAAEHLSTIRKTVPQKNRPEFPLIALFSLAAPLLPLS